MRRLIALGAVCLAVGFALTFWGLPALGETAYTPEANRCGKDIYKMYVFWENHIANTPDPQTTLETGIYMNGSGQPETYAQLLHRIAYYETNWC